MNSHGILIFLVFILLLIGSAFVGLSMPIECDYLCMEEYLNE